MSQAPADPAVGADETAAVASDIAERVLAVVRDVPDYPSAGVLFKDITPLLADPAVFGAVVEELAVRSGPVDVVVGIEARGFILAAPLALRLGAAFVPVRKAGKLPAATIGREYALEYGTATVEMHTDAIRPGQRVLVVDDVLATGGTLEAACALVEQLGGEVTQIAVLMEIAALPGRARLAGRDLTALTVV